MRFSSIVAPIVLTVACMTGCGGGGGNSNPSGHYVTGVAAAGSVLRGTVYLKDSSSVPREISQTIGSDGSYTFDVANMTKPFLLKAAGTANGTNYTLYSATLDVGTANVNPFTNLAVLDAAGGTDPKNVYTASDPARIRTVAYNMTGSVGNVQRGLSPLLRVYNLDAVDPVTSSYRADHTGLDGLLDKVRIESANGKVVVTNVASGGNIFTASTANIKGGALDQNQIPQATGGTGNTGGAGVAANINNGLWIAKLSLTDSTGIIDQEATYLALTKQTDNKVTIGIFNASPLQLVLTFSCTRNVNDCSFTGSSTTSSGVTIASLPGDLAIGGYDGLSGSQEIEISNGLTSIDLDLSFDLTRVNPALLTQTVALPSISTAPSTSHFYSPPSISGNILGTTMDAKTTCQNYNYACDGDYHCTDTGCVPYQ